MSRRARTILEAEINPTGLLKSRFGLSKEQQMVTLAIEAASLVLSVFEEARPNDDRPRKAIEAAMACVASPNEETAEKAKAAAHAAWRAAAAARRRGAARRSIRAAWEAAQAAWRAARAAWEAKDEDAAGEAGTAAASYAALAASKSKPEVLARIGEIRAEINRLKA